MNRRQKIVVSVTGILLVLLILIGLTYAYYLTRITGNGNSTSITLSTADLKLVYDDGSGLISVNGIVPGNVIGTKTFTVTNRGNATVNDYKVVLEYAVLEGVVPSVFERPQDFEINLTCKQVIDATNEEVGICNGYSGYWNNESFEMISNNIEKDIRHEYSLEIVYVEAGVDQSNDMNKNLNLKVQIYGKNETSTITGIVDNVDETYAMKLHSNPKISTIKNIGTLENPVYQYKFVGVENDTHTLTLINQNNSTESSGTLTINKGTDANINGNNVTVTENQANIYLSTSNQGSNLNSSANYNPYNNTNSLAYHIINNSVNNKNGTIYSDKPITFPGKVGSGLKYTRVSADEIMQFDAYPEEQYWWLYGDDYIFDETTGLFYLKERGVVDNHSFEAKKEDLIGKYLLSDSCYITRDEAIMRGNMISNSVVYQIIAVSNRFLTVKEVERNESIEIEESTLTFSQDDYGTSYYYRGNVQDNYVTYSNMCWRIVRIQGDGTIKLALADWQHPCGTSNGYSVTNSTSAFIVDSAGNIRKRIVYADTSSNLVSDYLFEYSNIPGLLNGFARNYNLDMSKLEEAEWCNDTANTSNDYYDEDYNLTTKENAFFINHRYAAYDRLSNLSTATPSFNCNTKGMEGTSGLSAQSTIYKNKLGVLTADEIVFAGNVFEEMEGVPNYYLKTNADGIYYTMTPGLVEFGSNYIFKTTLNSLNTIDSIDAPNGVVRLSVVLKYNVEILNGGDGTINNPYVIK